VRLELCLTYRHSVHTRPIACHGRSILPDKQGGASQRRYIRRFSQDSQSGCSGRDWLLRTPMLVICIYAAVVGQDGTGAPAAVQASL
jgi:hypothetical protein